MSLYLVLNFPGVSTVVCCVALPLGTQPSLSEECSEIWLVKFSLHVFSLVCVLIRVQDRTGCEYDNLTRCVVSTFCYLNAFVKSMQEREDVFIKHCLLGSGVRD